MRNGIEMNINADDFLGIIKAHLSETLGQEIEVNAECVTRYSGIYEDKSDDVEISYRKKEKINNYNVTVTVTLNKEDLKEILSDLIPDYTISDIFMGIGTTDYYESCKDFISATVTLKEKEKQKKRVLGDE